MTGWLTFWTLLLIVTLGAYAVLAVVVSVGGFGDMLSMFRQLKREQQPDNTSAAAEGPAAKAGTDSSDE